MVTLALLFMPSTTPLERAFGLLPNACQRYFVFFNIGIGVPGGGASDPSP